MTLHRACQSMHDHRVKRLLITISCMTQQASQRWQVHRGAAVAEQAESAHIRASRYMGATSP